jgi:hypothetical protein
MESYEWRREAARSSLNRLLPRLEDAHAKALTGLPGEWNRFKKRLNREWERLFVYLHELYGWQYDFFYTLEQVLDMLIQQWLDRPEAMKKLDEQREADPFWYLSEDIVGIVLYVDLFSDNLSGLEEALEKQDNDMIELAVRRINMLRSIQVSIGGIPLLYAGDEYGLLNDYTFLSDPIKANDSRWIHRSRKRWESAEDLTDTDTIEWRFFHEMVKLFKLRKQSPALRNGGMELVDTGNPHLFAYIRGDRKQRLLIVSNFSEFAQVMKFANLASAGMPNHAFDLFTQQAFPPGKDLELDGYRYVWIDISG